MALPKWYGRKGSRWNRVRAEVLRDSTRCVVCGHLGSQEVNHNVPRSVDIRLAMVRANLSPIHGWRGCPTCKVKCNQVLGTRMPGESRLGPGSRDW